MNKFCNIQSDEINTFLFSKSNDSKGTSRLKQEHFKLNVKNNQSTVQTCSNEDKKQQEFLPLVKERVSGSI